jgi:hypothetical protein
MRWPLLNGLLPLLLAGAMVPAKAQTAGASLAVQNGVAPAKLRSLVVAPGPAGVDVELALSSPVIPKLTELDAPARVVLDLPNTVSGTPRDNIKVARDGVRAVRVGVDGQVPPTTRIVVDLAQPGQYELIAGETTRIVLRIHAASRPVGVEAAPTKPTAPSQTTLAVQNGVAPAELRSLRVAPGPAGVDVELALSSPVIPKLTGLDSPARVVLDLPNTVSVTPRDHIKVARDGVSAVRVGVDGQVPPTTRIVVDLAQPGEYELIAGETTRMVLRIHAASRPVGVEAAPTKPTPSQSTRSVKELAVGEPLHQRQEALEVPTEIPVQPGALQPPSGQATTVTGVVEDQSGAVIPMVSVALVNKGTGQAQQGYSDNSGRFTFKNVRPGHYVLTGRAEDTEQANLRVEVDEAPVEVRLRLKVTVEEQVQVRAAEADPVAPDKNSDAVAFSDTLLRDLPTDSQNIVPLLSSFVAPAAGGTEGVSLVVDGVEADQIDDLPASAIKQVTIDRNPYAAQFRRPGKARIEITTKHGSPKRYHGQVGIFARDSVFDATNALAAQKPDLRRTLYEGTFGGPLGLPGASSFFLSAQHLGNTQDAIVNATILNAWNQPVPLVQNIPTGTHRSDYLARLDFHPGNVHTLTGFYSFDELFGSNRGVGGFALVDRGIPTSLRGHKFQFMDQAVLSPALLNTARLLLRQSSSRAGIPPGGYAIDVNGSFSSGPSPTSQQRRETVVEFEDGAAYARKNQTFRFGGGTRARFFDVTDQSNFAGTFRFSNLTQFSQGQPYVFSINQGQPNLSYAIHEASAFLQDEIRFHSTVSIVAGLRYDWQSTISNYNSLAPRLALAYSPGDHKTVFRGGAGMFYEHLPQSATEQSLLLNSGQVQQIVISNPSYPNPFSGGAMLPPSVVRIAPNLNTPYVIQASVSAERDLGGRNYLVIECQTLRGVHLLRSRDVNAPLPLTGVRPDANFFNINRAESTASMRSNALSLSYRGRVGRHFHAMVQYTFAKTTNDTSGVFSLPADNYDLRPEMGRADFDRRHRLNLAGVVNLPGEFRLGTVLSVASGIPFNITTGADNNHDSVANDRPVGVTRNTGNGPSLLQLDVRATKLFRVWRPVNRDRSSPNLELSGDAFNLLNHPTYPNFVGVITSPSFGRANTALPARTLQMSLSYRF